MGVETLHDWTEQIEQLGFSMKDELYMDRQQHKKFTFGNNASAAAIGKAYVNFGMFGHQLEIEVHVVEGATPFLLSAKFLADVNASINFRTGVAVFKKLSVQQYLLDRTAGGHLTIPLLGYPGNESVYRAQSIAEPDPGVQQVSSNSEGPPVPDADKGKPNEQDEH